MFSARSFGVSIARPVTEVYDYLAEPENLTNWMTVLGTRLRKADGAHWIAEAPVVDTGPITIGFSPRNRFGVLDYEFSHGDRTTTFPMRVLANDEGSEVVVTLFAPRGAGEAHLASEVEWLTTDLLTLKALLEH